MTATNTLAYCRASFNNNGKRFIMYVPEGPLPHLELSVMSDLKNNFVTESEDQYTEAIFLVVCAPSMNDL
jgi:hypothetical protein